MPSVRFARDKRGYEYVYLVHVPTRKGRPGKSRVLYWYRTPPGVRIGRKPFDEEIRQTLEAQNPGLTFDWEAIVATPMPPPDMTEYWRERRRLEKAARLERLAEEALEAAASRTDTSQAADGESSSDRVRALAKSLDNLATLENALEAGTTLDDESDDDAASEQDSASEPAAAELGSGPRGLDEPRRKRRGRGGRRKRGAPKAGEVAGPADDGSSGQNASEPLAALVADVRAETAELETPATRVSDPTPGSQIVVPADAGSSTSE